jgi:RNA polymerase sigma factor (sigma-70 family)
MIANLSTVTALPLKQRFGHASGNDLSTIRSARSMTAQRVLDDIDFVKRSAGTTALLKPDEELQLARQIFRYRQAFQRLILREPEVVDYLLELAEQAQRGQRRMDRVCELAVNKVARRQLLKSRIVNAGRTIRGMQRRAAEGQSARETRRIHTRIVRLMEELCIRQSFYQQAPYANPRAERLLNRYRQLCHQLAAANMRLVISIARQICGKAPYLSDMIQEGNRGLMHAVTRFDYRRGIRFSTYATPWIRKAILEALPNTDRNIRLPDNVQRVKRQYERDLAGRRKSDEDWSVGHVEQFARCQNIPCEDASRLLRSFRDTSSLDVAAGTAADGSTLASQIADEGQDDPHQRAVRHERDSLVRGFVQSLNRREESVINLRFGFDDGVHRTLAEVGRELKLTRERVRQIEKQAFLKLEEMDAVKAWAGEYRDEPVHAA